MPARITETVFQELVGRIYDMVCDPSCCSDFLCAFATAVDARGTLIFSHNMKTLEGSTAPDAASLNAAVNFDPEFLKSYDEYYSRVNVWGMNEPELKTGRAVTGSTLFPVRDLPKTEFYSDWLRPQDYFHVIGGVVVRDGPWATHFSSVRGRRADDFTSEQVQLYQALVPHLARAVRAARRFAFLQGLSASSLAVLDTLPVGVVLLNASSRVLHANAAAEAELRRGDPFRLGPAGEICIRGRLRTQVSLRAIIAAALDPVRGVQEKVPAVVQIARSGGDLLSVQALPLPRRDSPLSATMLGPQLATCALVIYGTASALPTIGPQLLQHVYGLTPAEVQIAIAIAEGQTVKEYMERRGISRNTAVTQLKRVFDKTGLKRQGELVRWLLGFGITLQPQQTNPH